MTQILSDRDAARLEEMLRWFDSNVDIRYQRRRRHGGQGGTRNRKAYAKAAAPASATITCYKDTDITGDEISVVCEVVGGTGFLNGALPRIATGTMITVWNDRGTWRSVMTFQASGDC